MGAQRPRASPLPGQAFEDGESDDEVLDKLLSLVLPLASEAEKVLNLAISSHKKLEKTAEVANNTTDDDESDDDDNDDDDDDDNGIRKKKGSTAAPKGRPRKKATTQ